MKHQIALSIWWAVQVIKALGLLMIVVVSTPIWLPGMVMDRAWHWVESEVQS